MINTLCQRQDFVAVNVMGTNCGKVILWILHFKSFSYYFIESVILSHVFFTFEIIYRFNIFTLLVSSESHHVLLCSII